ncbi:LOW QUALITY PROTEIN: alpha-N-acetylgalactosaminide alpha-2,6-sialyltransferase 2-like [Pristis pectinata]|uniref:LOW QUALITY PROTEIN: alpha-N-acetylgalactosaminide alpha-2,6-sialyltransferase 2-like n=1 Tax=Pristis pectinata TaxID=685728 RepID=UPI00223E4F5D|nr:LOW QUALITY PROTEIN: alpha-N-acetylgalactosaminide alpha-2,6-sialyltransferase 2-like [Pristis pectinata]
MKEQQYIFQVGMVYSQEGNLQEMELHFWGGVMLSKAREAKLLDTNDKNVNVSEKLDKPSKEVIFWNSPEIKGREEMWSWVSNTSTLKAHIKTPPPIREQKITTTPSYFGDWYPTDVTYLRSQCPVTARGRLANVSDYKGIFLGTVPILQWSKHVTEQAYQRLKRYNGAHGLSVINYEDLKDTLSYLNTSANAVLFDDWEQRPNKTSVCIRCAVVGNGGILNGSRKGKEIDGHDYVFRVNGAIIKGFEQDVGTRTSFYTFSTNTLKNSLYAYHRVGYTALPISEETRYIFLPDHDRDYYLAKAAITKTAIVKGRDKSQRPPNYFGENARPEKFKMYHPDFIRYLRNRFLRAKILSSRHRNIYRPTTGGTMLMAAIHSCDEVSAYGFITEDYAKYSDHYFDRTYHKVAFYSNHDMKMEMRLWKRLNELGIIKLYTRKNSENEMR